MRLREWPQRSSARCRAMRLLMSLSRGLVEILRTLAKFWRWFWIRDNRIELTNEKVRDLIAREERE